MTILLSAITTTVSRIVKVNGIIMETFALAITTTVSRIVKVNGIIMETFASAITTAACQSIHLLSQQQ